MTKPVLAALLLLVATGCDSPGLPDAGPSDAGGEADGGSAVDAGGPDAGPDEADAGRDAGAAPDDAGVALDDAGPEADAGSVASDAGPSCGPDLVGDLPDDAADLGAIADNASYPAGTEPVVLESRSDIDWYTYTVSDGRFGNVEPRVNLTELPGGARYELCLYFQCNSTLLSVGCESPAVAHELSADRHGCCITGTGTALQVKLTPVRCSGSNESGRVYARVSQQTGEALCTAYDLDWGDD